MSALVDGEDLDSLAERRRRSARTIEAQANRAARKAGHRGYSQLLGAILRRAGAGEIDACELVVAMLRPGSCGFSRRSFQTASGARQAQGIEHAHRAERLAHVVHDVFRTACGIRPRRRGGVAGGDRRLTASWNVTAAPADAA